MRGEDVDLWVLGLEGVQPLNLAALRFQATID
jgi:hypothetical protein